MSQNLFVGNLAYATNDDSLREFFAGIGEVTSARVISDKFSGRSKGFGFVEFANEADNQKAIDELDGKELDGRNINVRLSEPRADKPAGRGFGGDRKFGGNRNFGGDRKFEKRY